jgi:LPS sulfotransferase NodH
MSTEKVFLLMPWGRVGSNLIFDILWQQKCFKVGGNEPFSALGSELNTSADLQMSWLNKFLFENQKGLLKSSVQSILNHSDFIEKINEFDAKIIFVNRKNIIKTAISIVKARRYSEWHASNFGTPSWATKAGRTLDEKLYVDVNNFIETLKLVQGAVDTFKKYTTNLIGLTVWYEDLQVDVDSQLSRIFEFIEIEKGPYKVNHLKAVPDDISLAVENVQELKDSVGAYDASLLKFF